MSEEFLGSPFASGISSSAGMVERRCSTQLSGCPDHPASLHVLPLLKRPEEDTITADSPSICKSIPADMQWDSLHTAERSPNLQKT